MSPEPAVGTVVRLLEGTDPDVVEFGTWLLARAAGTRP